MVQELLGKIPGICPPDEHFYLYNIILNLATWPHFLQGKLEHVVLMWVAMHSAKILLL